MMAGRDCGPELMVGKDWGPQFFCSTCCGLLLVVSFVRWVDVKLGVGLLDLLIDGGMFRDFLGKFGLTDLLVSA